MLIVSHLAVSAVGRDGPGIVADLTGVLMDHGCNLEDGSMTLLGGHFAMTMLVEAPPGLDAPDLEAGLSAVACRRGLVMVVHPVPEPAPADEPGGDAWTVSVHGADHPGIVHRITASLAQAGGNVVGMTTRIVGAPGQPVYVMVLDVVLPGTVDSAALTSRLADLTAELGVACVAHPAQPDIL